MSSANNLFIVFNGLFSVAFLLSALVQWNDPDPLLWIVYYLSALICCVCAFRRLPIYLSLLMVAFGSLWAMKLVLNLVVEDVAMHEVFTSLAMNSNAVEEAREIGGLLMVVAWLSYLLIRQWNRSSLEARTD